MAPTDKVKIRNAFLKEMKAAEDRCFAKIKARAEQLAKDPELLKQMEKEIHGELCPTKTTSKDAGKNTK
jgi:hypothetical protein